MTRMLLASAASLGMMMGVAVAQSTTSQTTTTTTTAPMITVPMTTVDTRTVDNAVNPDGTRTKSIELSKKNPVGVVTETASSQTTYPLANMTTTTTTDMALNPDGTKTKTVTTDTRYASGMPVGHTTTTTILPP